MSYTVYSFYKHIRTSWEKGASMSDMYHMILEWMQTCHPQDTFPEIAPLVEQWLKEALEGEDTNTLVEDFLFSKEYQCIDELFSVHSVA
jgi:hypothetical protein